MNLTNRAVSPSWALTVLRVVTGIIFLMHGWQKLSIFGIDGFAGMLTGMGVPAPGFAAAIVTFVELLGGLLLVLGLGTRVVALLLAFDMLVALVLVHLPAGFFLPDGIEFVLLLLASSVALVLGGSGALALEDAVRGRRTVTGPARTA